MGWKVHEIPPTARQRIDYAPYENRRPASHAQPQPTICHEPVAAAPREKADPGRFRVRVVSYRQRLADPDNLCPKYFVDCLRYAEIIPDDTQANIELVISQEKVKSKQEERTELEVTSLPQKAPEPPAIV